MIESSHPARRVGVHLYANLHFHLALWRELGAMRPSTWSWIPITDVQQFEALITRRAFDGLVVAADDPHQWQSVTSFPGPVISVSDHFAERIRIRPDDQHAGCRAAEHLLAMGYTSFGFAGAAMTPWSSRRQDGFVSTLTAAGVQPAQLHVVDGDLDAWILGLPAGCGVFATNDHLAIGLLHRAWASGRSVPGQLGIVGVDNLEPICTQTDPPLSSLALPVGAMARAIIGSFSELFAGREVSHDQRIRFEPVCARGSSAGTAAHPIASAHAWMSSHLDQSIAVDQLAAMVDLPRRSFDQQFRRRYGCSPYRELTRLRLAAARRLLDDHERSIDSIAAACGFGSASRLIAAWRRAFGTTPGKERR
ncbi:MAG: substrate-binding domain-containing protein [Planctomycetota bacterium]|jgi:LacI family transcriptional regulator|nr:substrate-binding domain-containing protein [Planctomycetota bacterium]